MAPRLTTVLFDLDDTLLDSWRARVAALAEALDAAGIREPTAEHVFHSMRGRQLLGVIDELKAQTGVAYDLFTHYRRAYWLQGGDLVRLYPGVQRVLESLSGTGTKLGVVTQKERVFQVDSRRAGAHLELERTGIAGLIGATVGYEDVTRHKPDPEGIHLAMERLGARPGETLVVGDSAADLQAGLAAGCWTCHATWGLLPGHAGVDGVTPHAVATRPQDVLGLVRNS